MKQFLIIGAVCSTILVACNSANMDEITRKSNNTCFFEKIIPAEISTRVETRMIRTEKRDARGQLISPTQYETTRTQTITKPRSVTKIDAVCPEDLTPEFIASLQRAFQARGLFSAPVTGSLDVPTRRAISNFQTVRGIQSATLTIVTAQELGLVVIDQ